jgi:polyisoprenoid-binding protein YceI
MAITHNIKEILLSILMLGFSLSAHAEDGELCAPFKDASVNQNTLELMLQAATKGNLYRIESDSSKMGFCIDSPAGRVEAEFHSFKGGLALNDFKKQGTSLIQIDTDSLETDSLLIQIMMKSEVFFDSERYPNIIFESTGIEWISDKKGILLGDLTMHGVTKAVAFYVDFEEIKSESGKEMVTIKASTTVQRSEFGMYAMSPMVDDRVTLCMSVDAYKHQS